MTIRSARLHATWLLGSVALIFLATLPPQPEWPGAKRLFFSSLWPQTVEVGTDVIQNLLLYVPLGLILATRGTSVRRTLGVAAVFSLAVELLQFAIPGRSPTARDVLLNALGASFGWLILRTSMGGHAHLALVRVEHWVTRSARPDRRHASTLSLAWALLVTVLLTLTALLLTPAPLPRGSYAVGSPWLDREHGPLRIGSNGNRTGFFRGLIDEVRIYDEARGGEDISVGMLSSIDAAVTTPHLVAAYSFDSATAATLARDETGHGHDGQVHDGSWIATGKIGGALSFNGTASQVVIANDPSLDFRDAMTLEAWIFPSEARAEQPAVISRAGQTYYLDESSDEGRFRSVGGGRFGHISRYARIINPITPETWTHLATTYDGQAIRVYVNGHLEAVRTVWSPHRLEDVAINGVSIPVGKVADWAELRRLLRDGTTLNGVLTCGRAVDSRGPVFLIAGAWERDFVKLEARGADLAFYPWTWARWLKLQSPPSRLKAGLDRCDPGRQMRLTVDGHFQNPRMVLDGQTFHMDSLGVGSAWAFIFHSDLLPVGIQKSCTLAWLALLVLPIGFWARITIVCTVAIVITATAFFVVPIIFNIRPVDTSQLAALALGVSFGVLCRRGSSRYSHTPSSAS
jgi:VanZ family protein